MTEIAIDTCISDVLYERNRIVLPGLGLLETKPKAATVDHISNTIAPPSREITFNPNITVDDGVLINFIKKKYEREDLVVRKAVAEYITELKTRMSQKEIIAIPDVGRMYIDFEKKIQFLPDRVNYNKDSFGLPTVNFKDAKTPPPVNATQNIANVPPPVVPPVSTTQVNTPPAPMQEVMKEPVQETVIPQTPVMPSRDADFSSVLAKIFPFLLLLAIAAIGFIFYTIWADGSQPAVKDKIANTEGRLNTKPQMNEDARAEFDDDYSEEDEPNEIYDDSDYVDEEEDYEKDSYEEEETSAYSAGDNEAIVIVGGFSVISNARKLARKIEKLGYDSYIDEAGPINRVGVKFEYDSERDIINMVKQLRREFDKSSWVLVPEGFEVK